MCGVVGVFGHEHAAAVAYAALDALQHRGEVSAGIATRVNGDHRVITGSGRASEVFRDVDVMAWPGTSAVAHARYPTAGGTGPENAHPLKMTIGGIGDVSMAANGDTVNQEEIRARLVADGVTTSDCDTKLILHLMSYESGSVEQRLVGALRQIRGAYSLVVLAGDALIAVRGPHAIRPLVLGKLGDTWIVASETVALEAVKATVVRHLLPGEMIVWRGAEMVSSFPFGVLRRRHCIFEDIYFAWPGTDFEHGNVAEIRMEHGRALAREHPADADIVIPVLRSGYFASTGYAQELGLSVIEALLRAPRAGRTFILPGQDARMEAVRRKHHPIKGIIAGKRIVLVDDSIVRGTTMQRLVKLVFEAGAAEVHVRVASPPVIGPCYYGIDTPRRAELIAHNRTVEEISAFIGATTLGFLSIAALGAAGPCSADGARRGYCDACFSGDYPIPPE